LAADGMKAALVVLKQRLEELDAGLVAVIHDEVIVQTPPALADEVRGVVEQAMIDGMQTFVSSVPVTAEVVLGKSWAEKWLYWIWRRNVMVFNLEISSYIMTSKGFFWVAVWARFAGVVWSLEPGETWAHFAVEPYETSRALRVTSLVIQFG